MSPLSPLLKRLTLNTSENPEVAGEPSLKKPSGEPPGRVDPLSVDTLSRKPVPKRASVNSGLPLKQPSSAAPAPAQAQRGRAADVRPKPLGISEISPPGTPRTTVASVGETLLKAGLAEDCAILMRGALRHGRNGYHVGLNKVYGRALLAQGKATKAREMLRYAIILSEGRPDAQTRIALAEAQLQGGFAENAEDTLGVSDFVLRDQPLPADHLCMRAPRGKLVMSRLLRQLGKPTQAKRYLLAALRPENNPGEEEALEAGLLALALGDYTTALSHLLEEVGKAPKMPVALAEAHCLANQHQQNLDKFSMRAIADEPGLARFVAVSAAERGRYADAELLARVALSEKPGDADMGDLLWDMVKLQGGLVRDELGILQDDARGRLEARAYEARPAAKPVDETNPDAVSEEAYKAAVRFLVALAQRSGPNDQSWDFWHACAEYKGPAAAFAIYEARYQDADDASYDVRMGEKLVDWKALVNNTKYGDVPSREVMRQTVVGANLLKTARNRPLRAPSEASLQRRQEDLENCLARLDENDLALMRFRSALSVPETWEAVFSKAMHDPTLQDLESLRVYLDEAISANAEPTSRELSQYFCALGRACVKLDAKGRVMYDAQRRLTFDPGIMRVYGELALRLSDDAESTTQAFGLLEMVKKFQAYEEGMRNHAAAPQAAPAL